jgi:hypothetical protein
MPYIHTIRVGETDYEIAPAIDDTSADPGKTWSAKKLTETLGDLESALDAALAIQETLLGGDTL